jgi:hypothetical protein
MSTNSPGYNKAYYEKGKAEIITALGSCCTRCGTSADLEIHHINPCLKGRGRGMLARLTDWRRQLKQGNLKLLCAGCHDEVDHYPLVKAEKSRLINMPLEGVA